MRIESWKITPWRTWDICHLSTHILAIPFLFRFPFTNVSLVANGVEKRVEKIDFLSCGKWKYPRLPRLCKNVRRTNNATRGKMLNRVLVECCCCYKEIAKSIPFVNQPQYKNSISGWCQSRQTCLLLLVLTDTEPRSDLSSNVHQVNVMKRRSIWKFCSRKYFGKAEWVSWNLWRFTATCKSSAVSLLHLNLFGIRQAAIICSIGFDYSSFYIEILDMNEWLHICNLIRFVANFVIYSVHMLNFFATTEVFWRLIKTFVFAFPNLSLIAFLLCMIENLKPLKISLLS